MQDHRVRVTSCCAYSPIYKDGDGVFLWADRLDVYIQTGASCYLLCLKVIFIYLLKARQHGVYDEIVFFTVHLIFLHYHNTIVPNF